MQAVKRSVEEFADSTSRIIGCAMAVHPALGNGFQEVIYQRALELELGFSGLNLYGKWTCRYFIKALKWLQTGRLLCRKRDNG